MRNAIIDQIRNILTDGLVVDNDAYDNDLSEKVGFLIDSHFIVELVTIGEIVDGVYTNSLIMEMHEAQGDDAMELRNMSHIKNFDYKTAESNLYRCVSFEDAMARINKAIFISYQSDPNV